VLAPAILVSLASLVSAASAGEAPRVTGPSAAGALPPAVALVRGTFTEKEDPEGEGLAAARAFSLLAQALGMSGIDFEAVSDEAVAAGALARRRVAVVAYSPILAPLEREAFLEFVAGGGKLLVFYSADRALWRHLGIESARLRPRARAGEFEEMRFTEGALPFAPRAVFQGSWNILEVGPAPGARVLARWRDEKGDAVASAPAVVAGPGGAVVTHVMLGPVTGAKARMLLALAADLGGAAVMEPAARARLEAARGVRSFRGLGGLAELARALGDPRVDSAALVAALDEAARAERDAVAALDVGAFVSAYEQAARAEGRAREAAALALPPRDGEVRAVWVRTPEDVDWPDVAPKLARAGFNTVLPNYVRGCRAAYDSRVLGPAPPKLTAGSLATCIAECRRAGLEVHVWWTALFLDDTPPSRVGPLERARRVVRNTEGDVIGAPGSAWLCPSHAKNLELLRAAAGELALRFAIDGIHLDYARLPQERSCFCDGCMKALGVEVGNAEGAGKAAELLPGGARSAEFRRFRRERVAGAVEAIIRTARGARPGLLASAAVFPELALSRETLGQDWGDWVARGLIDFVTPMDYTTDVAELERWVRGQARDAAGRVPVVAGLGLAAGRSRLDDPAELVMQMAAARRGGADGFAIFQLSDDLLTKHVPLLARGPGREGALAGPVGGPLARWALPDGIEPGSVPAGVPLDVRVEIADRTVSGTPVRAFGTTADGDADAPRAPPRLALETATGRAIADLGSGPPTGVEVRLTLRAPAEPFRIVVRGEVETAHRSPRRVALRSPLFVGRTEAERAAERARVRPSGEGPRVAVLEGGYGSRGILTALRRTGRFAAYPISDLSGLEARGGDAPAVVVLPQRRAAAGPDADDRERVRRFVRNGGGALLTHDACGFRYHAGVFPEVASGAGRERSSTILPVPGGALAAAIGLKAVDHAHYDHIVLSTGDGGEVVARGGTGPVVVAGGFGGGRVVACGVAVGIDAGEHEHPPRGREAQMIEALVAWLARMDAGRADAAGREAR
jgi:uncharacterized lipoprotein YddW (UPF0748 family)